MAEEKPESGWFIPEFGKEYLLSYSPTRKNPEEIYGIYAGRRGTNHVFLAEHPTNGILVEYLSKISYVEHIAECFRHTTSDITGKEHLVIQTNTKQGIYDKNAQTEFALDKIRKAREKRLKSLEEKLDALNLGNESGVLPETNDDNLESGTFTPKLGELYVIGHSYSIDSKEKILGLYSGFKGKKHIFLSENEKEKKVEVYASNIKDNRQCYRRLEYDDEDKPFLLIDTWFEEKIASSYEKEFALQRIRAAKEKRIKSLEDHVNGHSAKEDDTK